MKNSYRKRLLKITKVLDYKFIIISVFSGRITNIVIIIYLSEFYQLKVERKTLVFQYNATIEKYYVIGTGYKVEDFDFDITLIITSILSLNIKTFKLNKSQFFREYRICEKKT